METVSKCDKESLEEKTHEKIMHINHLTANDELSRVLWTWILRWLARSFATHASLCNTLSSDKRHKCPKKVEILTVRGLKGSKKEKFVKNVKNIMLL